MRPGEREAWRKLDIAASKVAASKDYSEEFMAKIELREAWARLHSIPNVTGLPRIVRG
jgi:hypothetical protein